MSRPNTIRHAFLATTLLTASAATAFAQAAPSPYGRVSFFVNTALRQPAEGPSRRDTELTTALTFQIPDADVSGLDMGVDVRYSRFNPTDRPQRVSIYDAFAGARFGDSGQFRVRAGHLWLPDLGTVGALAGGLVEFRKPPAEPGGTRLRVGAFSGLEPLVFDAGYAAQVRKHGGYVAIEQGALRRHVVGYAQVRNGAVVERSVLTTTNFVPAGRQVFIYQAAEYDVTGPADGTSTRGLSYFFTNVRVSPSSRIELLGTYNRGRSLDARRLVDDLMHGRPLSPVDVEGLRYESRGGRVTVEVLRNVRLYAGYAQDRNNRDDEATGRFTIGGHAGNVLRTGFDLSASDALLERPTGSYHSRYVSVGRAIGRRVYASADYSTSLSVARYVRSDGLVIETRPSSRRVAGNVSATVSRHVSLLTSVDFTQDDTMDDLRILSGLTYRVR